MVVTNFPALRRMGLDKQCRARPRTYVVPIGLSLVGSDSLSSLIVWLPFLDTYRTMCIAPVPPFRRILEDIRELRVFSRVCQRRSKLRAS
jgi:hypothetical protein